MSARGVIVTGTDTGIGKTVFSAALMLGLRDAAYWKPLQSGTGDGTDTERVKALTGLDDVHFLAESHVLTQPLSPHRAAELDGMEIDVARIMPLETSRPLVIEGAGGLLVPVTRDRLQVDMFASWKMPVVLCARTALGTLNHTLLSVEALKARGIPLLGIAFVGEDNPDNMRTIAEFSGAKVLGRLPILDKPCRETLYAAFNDNFRREDFIHA